MSAETTTTGRTAGDPTAGDPTAGDRADGDRADGGRAAEDRTVGGRITTPFGARSTAAEVLSGVDLTGRRAVVTGSTSGIGVETARVLAAAGAEVTLAVRDAGAGAATAAGLTAATGNPRVSVAPLDLGDQASVAAFHAAWDGPLHILVNNAGIMAAPLTRTAEGWESQFAVNHLGHFALANGLHDALAAGAAESGEARVVSVASAGHLVGGVDFDDIHFERRTYDEWQAYGQAKTANILFALEADRRWAADGIRVNALTPGRIRTNLMRYIGDEFNPRVPSDFEATTGVVEWKTVEQGTATSALLAASPLLAGVGGRYFEDCAEALPNVPPARRGIALHARDAQAAARLWRVSAEMIADAA
jgi:NAD(P)-dependent dehydrogenase (short-subunit alcohol dehydrogenase family)